MVRTLFLFLYSFIALNAQIYKNPNYSIEDRVKNLLGLMSLDEKIGQMQQGAIFSDYDQFVKNVEKGRYGSFLNISEKDRQHELQEAAVNKSRLGIPLIYGRDIIHGFKTVFPIPLGQASTWNPEIVQQGSAVAAREGAEAGYQWTFAPMMDISRDPRWGRIAESCGEDPYLTSIISSAMIRGFQGNDLSAPNTIAACAKHFVGYGAAEGGKEYNTTLIPERELRDIYLRPFNTAVNANVATIMSAFNDIDGIPASGNAFTLRKILRDEWNFNGFVVSDWASVVEMVFHGNAKDTCEAAQKGLNAGINMEMASNSYTKYLKKLLDEGKVKIEWVDKLVGEILRIKFQLGLFEHPYRRYETAEKTLSPEFLEIAKESAIESVVLLKNEENLLPLNLNSIRKLAIIGPLADSKIDQLGTWTPDGDVNSAVTPLQAIRDEYSDQFEIAYSKGMNDCRTFDKDLFDEALSTTEDADAVLLFLGEDYKLSGEAHSRAFIDLPGAQKELIEKLSETGKPIILIIQAGRSLTFHESSKKVSSILYSFHAGTMTGPAISDIIFGKVSPSGRLPISFPKTVGQIPLYYNAKNTGRPPAKNQIVQEQGTPQNPVGYKSYYLDVSTQPEYYFGYGLTYSTIDYKNISLNKNTIGFDDTLRVSVKLQNSGNFDVKEVVQVYTRDLYGSVTRPIKELKRFKKVFIKSGEKLEVKFSLTSEDLKFHDINMEYNAEPGEFELFVGKSANNDDLLKVNFTLVQ